MSKDTVLGALLLVGGVAGIVLYGWLVFFSQPEWSLLVLKLTGFIAVTGVLAIVAWIGYTLDTTPSPPAMEELGKEPETESSESVEKS